MTTALKKYAKTKNTQVTPQSKKIPGSAQVANTGGGYSFKVTPWNQLDRFLILGTEGGTYYITENKLTEANASNVVKCIKEDGVRVVNRLVEISQEGRASKNDPAIFALALATVHGDEATKRLAYARLPQVCRIPTHLFNFAGFVGEMRGWGRGLKKAVANWYTSQEADKLAYAMIKYGQREGWSHGDLLRLSHPEQPSPEHASLFRYATQGLEGLGKREVTRKRNKNESVKKYPDVSKALPEIVRVFESLNGKTPIKDVLAAIEKFNLPHEAIPTDLKPNPKIWEALLKKGMPLTAMIRNLANMTRIGTLKPLSDTVGIVVKALTDPVALKKARIHPISILNAMKIYSSGQGRAGVSWSPIPAITDALNKAFYLSFKTVEPTGKKILLALDVSDSMTWHKCAGSDHITPREGSAAMALVTANVEANYHVVGFSSTMVPINVSPSMRLDEVIKEIQKTPAASTNCSLPMVWAREKNIDVDLFVIYTDNETNFGGIHPCQALVAYRKAVNPNARLAVISMEANKFSIADPNDSGTMDIVGFDANAPALLSEFALGRV